MDGRKRRELSRAAFVGRRIGLIALLLGTMLSARSAHAHGLNTSYTTITVLPERLSVVFAFTLVDMDAHFHINANGDAVISQEELHAAVPAMYEYFEAHATLTMDGSKVHLQWEQATLTEDAANQEFVNLAFSAPLHTKPSAVFVAFDLSPFELFGQTYTNLVKVVAGDRIQQAIVSLDNRRQQFLLAEEPPLRAQLGQFTLLGIKHIFLGYDHIMFLLALIIIGGRLWSLVKIVTAFTIAHSVSLILATLQVVTLPPRLIESGIALSIVYVAAENFFVEGVGHRWVLTFYFGLVHGFGFASVLRELGLPTKGLVLSLLAFNVGVELGQIAIVAVLFPITLWIAKQRFRRHVIVALSSVILCFGIGWFIERAFRFSFMPF